MRSLKMAAVAALMFASTAIPAFGAVVINAANTGYQFQIDYTGQVGGGTTNQVGGLGTFTFNGVTNAGRTYNFGYSILNDSTVASRLTSFALDVDPDATGAQSTGFFANTNFNNNFPEGYGTVDICFEADGNGNCTGGSGGLQMNQTGTGTFALTFASVMNQVTLDQFVTRFQSINPTINGSSSGIGVGALVSGNGGGGGGGITAPEPGTWLMMLGGFGLIGWAARRRRTGAPAKPGLAQAV
jgi:hypothetical protein